MIFNSDCRFFEGSKPCNFHKLDGRLCENCVDYDKIEVKILIVKLDALGDVLRTTSVLPALKNKYPHSQITWITKSNAIELLINNIHIDRVIAVEQNYLLLILNENFDLAICLDADQQSSSILSLVRAGKKVGFFTDEKGTVKPINESARDWYSMGLNDSLKRANRKTYHEVIYEICELNDNIFIPQFTIPKNSIDFAKSFSELHELNKFEKIIGINTGGGRRWQFKKWILDNYIKLIDTLCAQDNKYGILLYGGPDEKDFNEEIIRSIKYKIIDTGCFNSASNFAALINLSDIFITPDSLGMHLSIALEKITLVLVGPTSPWEIDIFGKGEIIYNDKLECIACYKSTCDFKLNCMNTLSPEFIYEKIIRYL